MTGFLASTGWPAVIAIVAQWFGKENLGLITGLWNAHTSVGNSVGSALSASVVHYGWGSAFLLLGAFMATCGVLFWFFLVPQPSDAGYAPETTQQQSSTSTRSLEATNQQPSVSPTLMHLVQLHGVLCVGRDII